MRNEEEEQQPKNTLVPALRFPEFQDAGEWEEKTLGEVVSIRSGYSPSKYNLKSNGKYPFVKVEDLNNCEKYQLKSREYSNDNHDIETVIPKESVIFPKRGAAIQLNKVRINQVPILMDTNMMGITPNNIIIKAEFLYYIILKDGLHKIADSSTIPQINNKHIEPYVVLLPSLPEQQKIADCLSSLDEWITAEGEKLEALKAHKKGLMQQLFPAQGETVPRLRFPEFQDAEEWEEGVMGDIYDFKVTNSFSRENLNYEHGNVKNVHYGDIHTKFSTLFDITKEEVPYINLDIPIKNIKAESYCVEGDIIFADASEDLNDIGKSIEIVNLNNEKLVSGLHTLLARQKEKKLIIGFGGYLFKSNSIRKQIQREAQGTKVLGISMGRISNVIISFPKNFQEQQKIADCLSSLDELITAQGEKVALLKAHKKGLMQGLFPVG